MESEPHPIAALLALRRISRRALAEYTGYSPRWIGKMINGEAEPSPAFRHAAAHLLEVPERDLFRPPRQRPNHPGNLALGRRS
jgi:transcriptional regulator with XRE-family HTH domain